MPTLPHRANLDHLRAQAKDLIHLYRRRDSGAIDHFAGALPAAAGRSRDDILALDLRLHDAQSCIAREYGLASWADLVAAVEAQSMARLSQADRLARWLRLVYGGDVTSSFDPARPMVAARLLSEVPDLADDPSVACAAGNEAGLRRAIAADPAWVNRPDGPLALPPLVAVTHSNLGKLAEFAERLRRAAGLLIRAGADPNQRIGNRLPPASLTTPDQRAPLSALYGAAGVNRDHALTLLLLDAGADPNDGESLYHSLEEVGCTRLLLGRGARVAGTNALRRALDMPTPDALELLLAHGGDPNEPASAGPTNVWGSPLLRAIALRCPPRFAEALLQAGADPRARTPAGVGAYRLGLQTGMTAVAALIEAAGAAETLSEDEEFVAACARADASAARGIRARRPDLPAALSDLQLRLLPDTIAWGDEAAARVMVELGWPIAVPGGDWKASALNLAVFSGNADLADFLLAHGASWRETQGYGDNVLGTLSWASVNQPNATGDWPACARVLRAHGVPRIERDGEDPERVLIDGRRARFAIEVVDALLDHDPGFGPS